MLSIILVVLSLVRLPDPYTKDGRKVSSVGQQFNNGLKQAGNYDALERSNVQAGGGVQFKNHDANQNRNCIYKS